MEYDEQTGCHRIRERIWQEGNLVKDEVKEVLWIWENTTGLLWLGRVKQFIYVTEIVFGSAIKKTVLGFNFFF